MVLTALTKERKEIAIQRICFPVIRESIGNRDVLINGLNDEILSTVSKRYTLVENERIFKPFVEHFGIDSVSKIMSWGRNKFHYVEFQTGRTFNFGTVDNPDIINERIVVQNSYNKMKSFSFSLGAYRWVCNNGLYSGHNVINYRQVHIGDIPIEDMINQTLANYKNNSFTNWEKLKRVELPKEDQLELINDFAPFEVKNENCFPRNKGNNQWVNESIRSVATYLINKESNIDNQRNGWGLINQFNRAIYHIVGRKQINKTILGNKLAERYLLDRLSLN